MRPKFLMSCCRLLCEWALLCHRKFAPIPDGQLCLRPDWKGWTCYKKFRWSCSMFCLIFIWAMRCQDEFTLTPNSLYICLFCGFLHVSTLLKGVDVWDGWSRNCLRVLHSFVETCFAIFHLSFYETWLCAGGHLERVCLPLVSLRVQLGCRLAFWLNQDLAPLLGRRPQIYNASSWPPRRPLCDCRAPTTLGTEQQRVPRPVHLWKGAQVEQFNVAIHRCFRQTPRTILVHRL